LVKWKDHLKIDPTTADSRKYWIQHHMTPAELAEVTAKLKSEVAKSLKDEDGNPDKE